MMIQEMKKCLPEEKRSSSKPSTISALNYALQCVQQVQGMYGKILEAQQLEQTYLAANNFKTNGSLPVVLQIADFLKHTGVGWGFLVEPSCSLFC